MFDIAYVVMHDCSKEYWNDALGFVIGVFGDDGAAKLALMQAGFTELDKNMVIIGKVLIGLGF